MLGLEKLGMKVISEYFGFWTVDLLYATLGGLFDDCPSFIDQIIIKTHYTDGMICVPLSGLSLPLSQCSVRVDRRLQLHLLLPHVH